MNHVFFQICENVIELRTERPLCWQGDMLSFSCGPKPVGLVLECRTAPSLFPTEGVCLYDKAERTVCRDGVFLVRYLSRHRGENPCIRLAYDHRQPDRAYLTIAEADWTWSMDHLRLWSTICLPQLLLPFRTLIFHTSYIDVGGQGILFTAPSGTGKSTQAELWRVHREARVLNGDKAGITLLGTPMVHGVPFSGTSKICENVSLPLRTIVVLSQAPVNTIRRLRPSEAAVALCSNLFVDQVIPEEWSLALNLLLDLVSSVPIYALACTPDERAVQTLEQVLQ